MAQKLTLENAGDEATFTVSACRTVQTKFGDRVVFVGTDDEGTEVETPLLPEATATKQLERIGLTSETVAGERLTFSRAANPSGRPYWNIDVPTAGSPAPRRLPAPEAAPAPAARPASPDTTALTTAYLTLWDNVALALSISAATHKVPLTADAVQAATATLWIAFQNRGLVPTPTPAKAPAIPTTPAPSGKRLAPPSAVVRGSPAGEPDFSKFPPPNDNDATDDLPF